MPLQSQHSIFYRTVRSGRGIAFVSAPLGFLCILYLEDWPFSILKLILLSKILFLTGQDPYNLK